MKEMQAVKILQEIGEFDNEIDTVEEISFQQSGQIENYKMLIGKKENEKTPLKHNIPSSSTVQIRKRKQNWSAELFESKKIMKFSEWEHQNSSLFNLHKHFLDYSLTTDFRLGRS